MPLRDRFKKKDSLEQSEVPTREAIEQDEPLPLQSPTFTFIRSDTFGEELISPPTFRENDPRDGSVGKGNEKDGERKSRLSISHHFRNRGRSTSKGSEASRESDWGSRSPSSHSHKRLSERLHLKKSETTSDFVPKDLPDIVGGDDNDGDKDGKESQWEKRATMLAMENEKNYSRSRPTTPVREQLAAMNIGAGAPASQSQEHIVSTQLVDDNIQEAIRLHEAGDLEKSTQMFGRLADPDGENNALSQVLYGLALRYVY